MAKQNLLGKNLAELQEICSLEGLSRFAPKQIADWLYVKRVRSIDDMTNISKSHRSILSQKYDIVYLPIEKVAKSSDGTKKYLFPVHTNSCVETVMIPDDDRSTICVSSQAGCRMGCKFCMTGRQGFKGNLDSGEIISQFLSIDESDILTNAVFMGMGEPLDNIENVFKAIEILTSEWGFAWSPKRITVSTIGVNVKKLLDFTKVHLAVSMHNPFPQERLEMMPCEHSNPLDQTIKLIKKYDFKGQRRVSFEYIMFDGLNDTKRHADAIVQKLKGLECRVNLIRFHDIKDTKFKSSPEFVIEKFRERLNNAGITTTIRASKGEDISAACGMLSGKINKELNI